MTQQSNRLQKVPILQRMPNTARGWQQFVNELSKWIIDITQAGRLSSDEVMPQVLLGNMGSAQTTLPLTSTDAGATATVTIAAHTLSRVPTTQLPGEPTPPSRDVSYNSGSITGLSFGTKYYIYTDDSEFAGGSVTYLSTTDKKTIVGDLGRYFLGEIVTPVDGAGDTTGAVGAGFSVFEDDSVIPALDKIATSSPAYTPTNDITDRAWNANAAVNGTGIDVAASSGTNVALLSDHDALVAVVQELSDVVATIAKDLKAKDVFG